jgi:K+-sensing histidine kinase KdpD
MDPGAGLEQFVDEMTLGERLSTLHDVALMIDDGESVEEILALVRAEARWLMGFHACFIALVNRARTHYVVRSLSTVADAADLEQKHFNIEEGIPGMVIKGRMPFRSGVQGERVSSPALEGRLEDLGIRSLLAVPMQSGSETIGCLAFGSAGRAGYTEEDLAIARLFAHHCAVALKNSTIFEDAGKRISQIELINEVSHRLRSMLNPEELLRVAAEAIRKAFNYFDVTVFLLDEDRTHLVLEAHSGSYGDFLPHGYRQDMEAGIVGWVASRDEKVLCNDVAQDPRYMAHAYHDTKSELAIPIRVEGMVVGVLNVEDRKLHAFDETDGVVLETLCEQLGGALKNARLYEEVQRTNLKLIELDKMKSEFLGIVSHDFRSPLSSIILAGKALLKNEDVQKVKRFKDYLQIIVDQANKLNQLAEDTLSITKIESGRLSYNFKVVNVERLIQDAISMVRISSRHTISLEVEPNVLFIKADQAKLRQVVQNLIGNAVKYSPRGGSITVSAREHETDQMLFRVSDEGIGIPAEKLDSLFRKFSRVDTGEGSQIKGAGLGLWICKEVVEAHGGTIWVESESGKGTTILFTIKKAPSPGQDFQPAGSGKGGA